MTDGQYLRSSNSKAINDEGGEAAPEDKEV